jgi:hypothetical protein
MDTSKNIKHRHFSYHVVEYDIQKTIPTVYIITMVIRNEINL